MSGEADYSPWDMSPASAAPVAYITQLLERLTAHDWKRIDTARASDVVNKLNSVRSMAGIPFVPFDGVSI